MICGLRPAAWYLPPRSRAAGFTLLELAVVACIYGVLLVVFLDRLLYYQELGEKARTEYIVSTLKAALQVRVGTLIAEGRHVDYGSVRRENPVSWLEQPMAGYGGELTPGRAMRLAPGHWYFDTASAEMIYLPALTRHLQRTAERPLRWHVEVLRPAGARGRADVVAGLRFTAVDAYRWF